MKGVIESANRNKSGKSTMVTVSGQKYMCNKLEIEQHIGKEIEYETGAYKDFKTIERFTVTTSGPAPQIQGNGGSVDRYWMPFLSNTIAHGITAGLIKNPSEISAWAKAVKDAASDIDNPY